MGCAFSFGVSACRVLGFAVVSRTPFFRCDTAGCRDPFGVAQGRLFDCLG
jgi:hypothetical protein